MVVKDLVKIDFSGNHFFFKISKCMLVIFNFKKKFISKTLNKTETNLEMTK